MANRYSELLEAGPKGSFWDAYGLVLPFRDSAYEFLFTTGEATKEYQVFVNDAHVGPVATDALGDVIVTVTLGLGRSEIKLVGDASGDTFRAYVVTRNTATWLAAYADVFESIDTSIEDTRNALKLESVNSSFIEDVFGRTLAQPNDIGFLQEGYRRLLRELRQGFRFWGGRLAGVRQVVNAFTDVNPLVLPKSWRPSWILGTQLLANNEFSTLGRVTSTDIVSPAVAALGASNLNQVSLRYVHTTVLATASNVFPGPIQDPPNGAERLIVLVTSGWDGGSVTVVGTDVLGNSITEVFTDPAGSPSPATVILLGTKEFASITSITKSVIGVAVAGVQVGLRDSRYLRIVGFGPGNPKGSVSRDLTHNGGTLGNPDRIRWATALSAGTTGKAVSDGLNRIPDDTGVQAEIASILRAPDLTTATFDTNASIGAYTGRYDKLYIEIDEKGIVPVELQAGTAGVLDLQEVIDSINDSFRREGPYGAVRPSSVLTFTDIPTDALYFDLDDGVNNQEFEFDDDSVDGTGTSISFVAGTTYRLNASGTPFQASHVGDTVTITGAALGTPGANGPGNNGTFTITAQAGTSIDYTNANGAAETSSFDWVVSDVGASRIPVDLTTNLSTDPAPISLLNLVSRLVSAIQLSGILISAQVDDSTDETLRQNIGTGTAGAADVFTTTLELPAIDIKNQTGTATITGTAPNMTLTDPNATGARAFLAEDVGREIWVEDTTTATNSGNFVITSVNGPTSVNFTNASGVAEPFAAASTWRVRRTYVGTGVISFVAGTTYRITDTTGAVGQNVFVAADVGKYLDLTGATTGANNGRFLVTARTASTIDYTNAAGVAEPFAAATRWEVLKHIPRGGLTVRNPGVGSSTVYGTGTAEAVDDGAGNIVAAPGTANTVTGTINYLTGAISVDENGTDTWTTSEAVDVDYETTDVGDQVTLTHAYGGTQSIIDFTDNTGGVVVVTPDPATGTNSTTHASVAGNILNPVAGFTDRVLRVQGPIPPVPPTQYSKSSVRLHRDGADASAEIFGLPTAQTALAAAEVPGDISLDASGAGTTTLPPIDRNIVIEGFFDGTFTTGTPTNQPTKPTALEVVFGPAWDGGDIRVTGTGCYGEAVQETIPAPSSPIIVDSGTDAAGSGASDPTAGTRFDVIKLEDTLLPTVKAGMIFEVLTGARAGETSPIKFVGVSSADPSEKRLLLRTALTGAIDSAGSPADWRITTVQTVKGVSTFKAITTIENLTLGTSVGAARVQILDGPQTYGYNVVIGRGLRQNGDDGQVVPLSLTGETAAFRGPSGTGDHILAGAPVTLTDNSGLNSTAGGPFTASMVGRSVTVTGASNGGNNNTFTITAVPNANQIQFTNGSAVTETSAFTWSVAPIYEAKVGDVQGYIKITSGAEYAGNNNGLHKINTFDPLLEGTGLTFLRHEKAKYGQRFVPGEYFTPFDEEPNLDWEVYALGEVHRVIVNNQGTGVLTIDGMGPSVGSGFGGLADNMEIGRRVEVERDLPLEDRAAEDGGLGWIDVEIDSQLSPGVGPETDAITVESGDVSNDGGGIPDGWIVTNADLTNSNTPYPGYFGDFRFVVEADAVGDVRIERDIPKVLPDYKGFVLACAFWVQQHNVSGTRDFRIDMSFDGGSSFVSGTPVSVTGTVGTLTNGASLNPTQITETFEVPVTATSAIVRLSMLSAAAAGELFSVEQASVVATHATGYFLGNNTVIRSGRRQDFGEVLYVWSPEDLTVSENRALGVPEVSTPQLSTPSEIGQIDRVQVAHGEWERFDISEYTGADPLNVLGIYDEADWGTVGLTNMEISVRTPPRLSYVTPSRISQVTGEALTFTAPSNAALTVTSSHAGPFPEAGGDKDILYADGVPVPETPGAGASSLPWRFISAGSIQVASLGAGDPAAEVEFDPAASYTLDYEALIRASSPVIDLGASYTDYLWLADSKIYRRAETEVVTRVQTVQVTFRADYTAELIDPSDQDQSSSTLTANDGLVETIVPAANWRYTGSNILEIDSSVFNADALYTLEYTSRAGNQERGVGVVIEVRSGTSEPNALADTWRTAVIDEPVRRDHRYHQIRVTFTNVVDTREVVLGGMGFKGIRLYGSPPYAPGILTCEDLP